MTESEWMAATDPSRMLDFLRGRVVAGERKLRLFQVACCRRIWRFVADPESRAWVELVERAADAPVDEREWSAVPYDRLTDDCGGPGPAERHAFMVAGHVGYSLLGPAHGSPFPRDDWRDAVGAAEGTAVVVDLARGGRGDGDAERVERVVQAGLLRCIFGSPFSSAHFDARWRTETVVLLAREMYQTRDFGAMPVLADALEESGCDNEEALNHCRGGGPHARGCWVADLVLGKS